MQASSLLLSLLKCSILELCCCCCVTDCFAVSSNTPNFLDIIFVIVVSILFLFVFFLFFPRFFLRALIFVSSHDELLLILIAGVFVMLLLLWIISTCFELISIYYIYVIALNIINDSLWFGCSVSEEMLAVSQLIGEEKMVKWIFVIFLLRFVRYEAPTHSSSSSATHTHPRT